MAGLGIRAYELAKVLASQADVLVAAPHSGAPPPEDISVVPYSIRAPDELAGHIDGADVVIAQPQWPALARRLRRSRARLIFDLVTPEPLEALETLKGMSSVSRRLWTTLTVDRFSDALRDGHHFICASERQRDLWLGAMLAERLINPAVYDRDPTLRSVIDTVPFGVPSTPPATTGHGPRERFERLTQEDEIVLWNGGIWDWLDAPTAVRAIGLLAERRPQARLVFIGAAAHGAARRGTEQVRTLADELGLLDRLVFFNDRWVPYQQRADWLLESSCCISTHVEHLETRFAFRTRMLDCFWAGLPIVCTGGDILADRVERDELGAVVPEADPHGVASGLATVLEAGRDRYAAALARAAEDNAWRRVAEPLMRYVALSRMPRQRPAARLLRELGRQPGQRVRAVAYRAARGALNQVGLGDWPPR